MRGTPSLRIRGSRLWIFACLSLVWTFGRISGQGTPHQHSVRLVNGSTKYEGRVEVYWNGTWAQICGDGWDLNDAYVVCRQLGYGTARNATAEGGAFPGPGRAGDDYWAERVRCRGGEERLDQCPLDGRGGVSGCPSGDTAAGVVCQAYDPTDSVTIRLEGSSNQYEGLVRVFRSGAWGTICADRWGMEEADVACRQLGFLGAQVAVDAKALFGADRAGPVYLAGLRCHGTETNLAQCARDGWTDRQCSGNDGEAGVVCNSRDTPASGDLRLTGDGGARPAAGRLEVYHLGVWGTVCADGWTEKAARVACRQLGYNGVEVASDNADYGVHTGAILLDNLRCTGYESRLTHCPNNGWGQHNCLHTQDVAVRCRADDSQPPLPPSASDTLEMSSIIGIIVACTVFISCALMILRYIHYRQNNNATPAAHRDRVWAQDLPGPEAAAMDPVRHPALPRAHSGLFLVNGIQIAHRGLPGLHGPSQPPGYSCSGPRKPPGEIPAEAPPSYQAAVAHYPDARRAAGAASPVAPDYYYYYEESLPNAVVGELRCAGPRGRGREGGGESGPGFEPASRPSSPSTCYQWSN